MLQGDSGGPGTVKLGDQHVLVGVISRGACGWRSLLIRVTEVRQFIDWVVGKNRVAEDEFCPNGSEADVKI